MARLGTWDTFDCPVDDEKTREAYRWLHEKVTALGGQVRKVMNAHDFGMYPSFEIDCPSELEDITYDDMSEVDDDSCEEDIKLKAMYDAWNDGIDNVEKEFCKLFHND